MGKIKFKKTEMTMRDKERWKLSFKNFLLTFLLVKKSKKFLTKVKERYKLTYDNQIIFSYAI